MQDIDKCFTEITTWDVAVKPYSDVNIMHA